MLPRNTLKCAKKRKGKLIKRFVKEQGIGSTGAFLAETLLKLIDDGKIRIPRGGYLVTRGRGRVVVTRPKSE
jgi:hypothetical protein